MKANLKTFSPKKKKTDIENIKTQRLNIFVISIDDIDIYESCFILFLNKQTRQSEKEPRRSSRNG